MYHYVRNNEDHSYDCYCRRLDEFESQIKYLKNKAHIINIFDKDEMNFYLSSKKERAFMFSFDDGYKDHLQCAEILRGHNLKGIFFPPINILRGEILDVNAIHQIIGSRDIKISSVLEFIISQIKEHKYEVSLNGEKLSIKEYQQKLGTSKYDGKEVTAIKLLLQRDIVGELNRKIIIEKVQSFFSAKISGRDSNRLYLNESDIKKMYSIGMQFGSHGLTHKWLNCLDYNQQYYEINESFKRLISIGAMGEKDLKFLCYPYGAFNKTTLKVLKKLNIDFALVDFGGTAFLENSKMNEEDIYKLRRWDTNEFWDNNLRRPIIPNSIN